MHHCCGPDGMNTVLHSMLGLYNHCPYKGVTDDLMQPEATCFGTLTILFQVH